MIALVAITDSYGPPPAPPLSVVISGSLAGLCVPADDQPVSADVLIRRGELLDGLMEDRDLLPVQFGTALADERVAERVLFERHDEFTVALDRVRGAVEIGLRVQPVEQAGETRTTTSSGREFLRSRAGRLESAHRVHERLAAMSRAATTRSGPDLLRAAYLVDRTAVTSFVEEVRRLSQSCTELALLCTGPWPAFSFTDPEPDS